MINLIYSSKAISVYSLNDLNLLLAECRLKNTFLGITGILLYHEGSIMQIFEGDADAVHKLYSHVKKDKRHKNVKTVAEYTIERRNYANWSMAFKEISSNDWSGIESCLLYTVSDTIYPVATSINAPLIAIIDSFINLSTEK